MKASIDSASLILMLKVPELIPIVKSYLASIYATDKIYQEVFEAKNSPETINFDKQQIFFQVKNPKKLIQTKLGEGELSAISLAFEEKIVFLSEDKKAIQFARSLGLKHASILSILIKAKEDRKVTKEKAKGILFKLVENRFYISSELFSAVLKRLEK